MGGGGVTLPPRRYSLRAHPEAAAIVEYLREHGPATSREMRSAGLDATHSNLLHLKVSGYIEKARIDPQGTAVWRAVR